ncbi:site-specific tyrosine recombinase/integron integrase [Oceanihabitans sp. IOP_32]|uniref:site-specific tyrosine recombinase/integron integrase n=1 Tax=Oceanihabitans sp. IOP_32 TaxID=2529032 RepID=UPI001D177EDA|nr:site-specific tyrosine recombinase/integron integrase [Oceanihabitans sp. IOP_32]
MLPRVQLIKFQYQKQYQIGIKYDYNRTLKLIAKSFPSCRWSDTHKTWYVSFSEENIQLIKQKYQNHAFVDETGLSANNMAKVKNTSTKVERQLNDSQKTLLNNFYKYLRGKRYSKSTINIYVFFMADFVEFYSEKPVDTLNNRDVEVFIESVFIKRGYSISSQRQFISALKAFILFEPCTQIEGLELVRPYKSLKLPVVLSQKEVIDLIAATKNLKHRAIIVMLYSCGLRISEAMHLTVSDIDIERRQIHIQNSKGRKDRYVGFAKSFLPLLKNYLNTYQPKYYFIEGTNGKPYSPQSVRQFLKRSCKTAGIIKKVTPHTLRHSYATHLLENGVDIRYIQSLLGHSRPETTMIYTHVRKSDLLEIENPLDVAVRNFKLLR